MRRKRITIGLLSMMMTVTSVFGGVNVSAATPKITVNQVYKNATKIKGKAKKKTVVKVKIGKKTYQAKVSKKGNYSIKVPKIKTNVKYTIKGYQKKKLYAKKSFYAVVKGIEVDPFTEKDHVISGYTAQTAYVVLKSNGKVYTTTSKNSGYFKIDTKTPLEKNNIEIKVYKKGKVVAKYWKEYQETSQKIDQNDETDQISEHDHSYNIPVYETKHVKESGHYETITTPDSYPKQEVTHDICLTCKKDLTQEYVDGIRKGKYKENKIPASSKHVDTTKSREILNSYPDIQWNDDIPLYEDFLAYGGWDHTCTDHEIDQQKETIYSFSSGAIYTKWIVDQEACDKKVLTGYQCSCGDIKKVDTTEHQHLYNIPVYKMEHVEEMKHLETITIPGKMVTTKITHHICRECSKNLTKEYVDGIKNGEYKTHKIPTNKLNTDKTTSKNLLSVYGIEWKNSYPLYEDFLVYGGWDHTCAKHSLREETSIHGHKTDDEVLTKWVVDQVAHDEQELIGFQCGCGETYNIENY